MSDDPKYDVAISFLAKDQATASALADKLVSSGFTVFFFPRNQEALAGTNGMESMREPFFSSRVNVVMFRDPWGRTPWTGIEQTAIQERCLESGWESLVFVQLDETSPVPKWLPTTHVRFALKLYGLEQLTGAVKARVQEQGGIVTPPDAMSEAQRVKREADYMRDRDHFMRDGRWIEGVHQCLRNTFTRVEEMVEKINNEQDFRIDVGSEGHRTCIMRSGYVSLAIKWHQHISGSVANDQRGDCYLRVEEFSGALRIPGRNEMWDRAQRLREHRFKPDVSETRDLVWVLGNERIAPEDLADRIVILLVNLISRMNRGEVARPGL